MSAEKFLKIVYRVDAELHLATEAEARIHAAFRDQPAALFAVEAVTPQDGQIWVELSPDRTRCKAAERRRAVSDGACCGATPSTAPEIEGCCAAASGPAAAGAACCA